MEEVNNKKKMILFPHGEALRIFEEQREKKKIRSVTVRSILKFSAKTKKKKSLPKNREPLSTRRPAGSAPPFLFPFNIYRHTPTPHHPHPTPTRPGIKWFKFSDSQKTGFRH